MKFSRSAPLGVPMPIDAAMPVQLAGLGLDMQPNRGVPAIEKGGVKTV